MPATPTPPSPPPAIVLLSGGLDSATVLAIARQQGFACHALVFDYGQRHRHELDAADRVAAALGAASLTRLAIDLRAFGGSALTDVHLAVPKDRDDASIAHGIPITYVPARNLIFLSFAAAAAEVRSARDIFIGVNAIDYSGYPDCREEFIRSFEETANLATRAGVEHAAAAAGGDPFLRIRAPLAHMTKADIIRAGTRLGVDYSLTHSCYDPISRGDVLACGHCDSCLLRAKGFAEAGVPDPTRYA